tara:strand:- start:617 stop:1078 length:462 start_codon:yes stop_codon:yes gene_type:complete
VLPFLLGFVLWLSPLVNDVQSQEFAGPCDEVIDLIATSSVAGFATRRWRASERSSAPSQVAPRPYSMQSAVQPRWPPRLSTRHPTYSVLAPEVSVFGQDQLCACAIGSSSASVAASLLAVTFKRTIMSARHDRSAAACAFSFDTSLTAEENVF